jgi:hypothetical protein
MKNPGNAASLKKHSYFSKCVEEHHPTKSLRTAYQVSTLPPKASALNNGKRERNSLQNSSINAKQHPPPQHADNVEEKARDKYQEGEAPASSGLTQSHICTLQRDTEIPEKEGNPVQNPMHPG